MKKHLPLFLFLLLGLAACIDVDEYDTSARGNFEALWHIMDEHYCFFEEKQAAYGVDCTSISMLLSTWHATGRGRRTTQRISPTRSSAAISAPTTA